MHRHWQDHLLCLFFNTIFRFSFLTKCEMKFLRNINKWVCREYFSFLLFLVSSGFSFSILLIHFSLMVNYLYALAQLNDNYEKELGYECIFFVSPVDSIFSGNGLNDCTHQCLHNNVKKKRSYMHNATPSSHNTEYGIWNAENSSTGVWRIWRTKRCTYLIQIKYLFERWFLFVRFLFYSNSMHFEQTTDYRLHYAWTQRR